MGSGRVAGRTSDGMFRDVVVRTRLDGFLVGFSGFSDCWTEARCFLGETTGSVFTGSRRGQCESCLFHRYKRTARKNRSSRREWVGIHICVPFFGRGGRSLPTELERFGLGLAFIIILLHAEFPLCTCFDGLDRLFNWLFFRWRLKQRHAPSFEFWTTLSPSPSSLEIHGKNHFVALHRHVGLVLYR